MIDSAPARPARMLARSRRSKSRILIGRPSRLCVSWSAPTRAITSWPRESSSRTACEPTNPLAPVTAQIAMPSPSRARLPACLHANRRTGEMLAQIPHGAADLVCVGDRLLACRRDPLPLLLPDHERRQKLHDVHVTAG